MSDMSNAERYLEIKEQIKALEAEKKELSKSLKVGERVRHNGILYEWIAYENSSTSWKPLYEQAYRMLDDEAQVIMGEAVDKAKKPRIDHKFEKKS